MSYELRVGIGYVSIVRRSAISTNAVLDCYFAAAGHIVPVSTYPVVVNNCSTIMQSNCRANVKGNAVQYITNIIGSAFSNFEDHMFFAVTNRGKITPIQEIYALRNRVFGCDGLVSEVDADNIRCGFRNHPRNHKRCKSKLLLFENLRIPYVPINKRTRTTFHIAAQAMNRVGGSAAYNECQLRVKFIP